MFYTANGWTKEKMINHIKANFKGKAFETRPNNRHGELGSEDMCVYKTQDGKKCGIGLFIDEETHDTRHLDGTIRSLLFKWPDLEKQMPLSSVQGLTELQRAHDNSRPELTLQEMIHFVETKVVDMPYVGRGF